MGIFASLYGILACLLQRIWDSWYPPIQASLKLFCLFNPFIMLLTVFLKMLHYHGMQ